MIKKYLAGKGIDVGKEHALLQAEHKYIAPDNLYLLRNEVGIETYDYLYSHNCINDTKYFRILLYEWFLVVKKGGYIIIDFEDNEILDLDRLKDEIATLFQYRNKHKIVNKEAKGKLKKVVVKKLESIRNDDGINQWTFGIVSNGKRKDLIKKTIASIRALKIPQYEIIFCGTYHGEVGGDIRYINFTEHDDRGWITRKKNLVCEKARFKNIVVIHDRINFESTWFEGMKRWGDYFDVLGGPIYYPTMGVTKTNWDTMGFRITPERLNRVNAVSAGLDPTDWDRYAIIGGPLIIIKKSIWKLAKWNEDLFWGDWEDVELSHRQSDEGILLRFNPWAEFRSEIVTVPLLNFRYEKDTRKLGRLRTNPLFLVGIRVLDLLGFRRKGRLVRLISRMLDRIYKAKSWKREAGTLNR